MGRKSASEKVDLHRVLAMIRSDPGLRSGEFVTWLMDSFAVSQRAAKDALGVLRAAGFIEATHDTRDGRVRRYEVSERGLRAVEAPAGAALLAFARGLYSTCVTAKRAQHLRGRGLGDLEERLARAEAYFLGPTRELPAALPAWTSPLPAAAQNGAVLAHPLIEQSRCKVCRSPYRAEIELSLAAGNSQASVRREFNERVGTNHFTASGISRHVLGHLNEHDPQVREILQSRVQRAEEARSVAHGHASRLVQSGLAALQAGIVQSTPRDMLRAVKALDELGGNQENAQQALDEMTFEFRTFVEAVEAVVGRRDFEAITARYSTLASTVERDRDLLKRRRLLDPSFSFDPT